MALTSVDTKTWKATLLGGDVEIGDVTSATFKPHIKLKRWDGECEIGFAFPTTRTTNATLVDGKLVWNGGANYEARFYEITPGTNGHNELGGFEFELVLKKKPPVNSFTFTVDTKNLNWYYQPPLTPEEIAEGTIRPDDVVGSYAVYHATKTNMHASKTDAEKYKAGKAFHLYRPKVTDNAGKSTWATLNLAGNQMTLTIDQAWLNTAVYPVVIDPNFGWETAGVTAYNGNLDLMKGGKFTCPEAGTAQSITFWLATHSYDDGPRDLAIYRYSDGAYLASTGEYSGETPGNWVTHNLTSNPALTNQAYWLVHWGEEYVLMGDEGAGVSLSISAAYPGSWADPISPSEGDIRYAIYCTYTTGGAPAPPGGILSRNRVIIIG